MQPTAAFANRADILRADIPAQGRMSARVVARMYAALLGHIDGVRLVSPDHLAAMATPAFRGTDQVVGIPTTWALGYSSACLEGEDRLGSTFGIVGSNGRAAYADLDSGLAVGVMRNRIIGDWAVAAAIDRLVIEAFDR